MLKISHLPKKLFNQETKIPPKTTIIRCKNDKICSKDEFVGHNLIRPSLWEVFIDLISGVF